MHFLILIFFMLGLFDFRSYGYSRDLHRKLAGSNTQCNLDFTHRKLADSNTQCPLDFTILRKFSDFARKSAFSSVTTQCQLSLQGLHLVLAQYLQTTGLFLPPLNASDSCWVFYETVIHEVYPGFDVRTTCGFETSWISQGCMNISSLAQFESIVPESSRQDVARLCNQSLLNNAPCASCNTGLSTLGSIYLNSSSASNVTDCSAYPSIYVAGRVNLFGPTDDGTASCLFLLQANTSGKKNRSWILGLVVACFALALGLICLGYLYRRWKMMRIESAREILLIARNSRNSRLDSINANTTLVKFKFEEIKASTNNFSRYNIIGKGSYGNVYKGILADGSEVALKRFKNCSAAGDTSFAHEVEVIASVRHRNLVALRGFCTATTPLEGHQRIIVCDLIHNGSLYDHLFGSSERKLNWPERQKIAVGMARGLAYLHYGAQPAIIHRDIKASNILLDESFEPKVADFGLAKFTPEGMSHLSTRVAGTLGYVAPEYALYGQLTEKSDVYSFGVVLLELLSGRKALVSNNQAQPFVLTDWAWSLVRSGRFLDVIEECMTDLGPSEVMERYVLVAVLCSHPEMHARPTMDQILKILESDKEIPPIPDRAISLVAHKDEIDRSMSSSGSGQLSSPTGYRPFNSDNGSLSSEFKG